MAKNIIPPDPIPIKDLEIDIPVGCAMFTNYSSQASDNILQKIIQYLDTNCQNATYLGNHLYEIKNISERDCESFLQSEIDNIDEKDIQSHVLIMPGNSDDSCLISIF